jgi:ABC-type dipeptide/oligopeptide/nickel transport system permease subunit
MFQKLLGDWNDLLIFLIVLYSSLVFFGVLKYPSASWELKVEKAKSSKSGFWLKILLPLLTIFFLVKIIFELLDD